MMRLNRLPFVRWFAGVLALMLSCLAALDSTALPPDFPGLDLPVLLSFTPNLNQTEVPLNSPVVFNFLSEMTTTQAISWSSNVIGTNFACSWSADAKTLTCIYFTNFPTNATITWLLD